MAKTCFIISACISFVNYIQVLKKRIKAVVFNRNNSLDSVKYYALICQKPLIMKLVNQ